MSKNYYAILGVSRTASAAAIHSAFRALARRYHPDVGSGASPNKFSEALEAYQTLSDPSRRQQHDIDLGRPMEFSKTAVEPLFQERRYPVTSLRRTFFEDNDPFLDLLRWMESEFDVSVSRYFR